MSKRATQFTVRLFFLVLVSCFACKQREPLPDPGSSGGSFAMPNVIAPMSSDGSCFAFGNHFPTTVGTIPPQAPGDVAEDHIHTIDVTDEGHGQTNFTGTNTPISYHDHGHPIGAWQVSEVLGHTHVIIRLPKCP